MAQNTGILHLMEMTFSGKHQQLHQHSEEVPEGILHDQTPAPDPAENQLKIKSDNEQIPE